MVAVLLYNAWILASVESIQSITAYVFGHIVERLIIISGPGLPQ